jgi:hypothetical protein
VSEKSEGLKRIEKRLEEELAEEDKHTKDYPKLAKAAVQGAALQKEAVVKLTDGKKYCVTIRALSEGEVNEALDQAGMEYRDLGDPQKVKTNMRFQHIVCAKSMGDWTPEEVAEKFMWGQSARLTFRILALSDLPVTEEKLDSFRPQ